MTYLPACRQCGITFESEYPARKWCSDWCYFYANANVGEPDACWPWMGRVYGYGVVERTRGRKIKAPRFAFALFHGDIPEGMLIRHSCNNPPCVNPKHLLLGWPLDNARDMIDSGRQAWGERHGNAKLTRELVAAIRADSSMSAPEWASRLGVSPSAIRHVRNRVSWGMMERM